MTQKVFALGVAVLMMLALIGTVISSSSALAEGDASPFISGPGGIGSLSKEEYKTAVAQARQSGTGCVNVYSNVTVYSNGFVRWRRGPISFWMNREGQKSHQNLQANEKIKSGWPSTDPLSFKKASGFVSVPKTPVASGNPNPVASRKPDPMLAEQTMKRFQKALADIKEAGRRAGKIAEVDITKQLRQQLIRFEEKVNDKGVNMKDAQAVIDVMQIQASSLLKTIADSKGLGLAEMKEQAITSLTQLSEQLIAKASQYEEAASGETKPEWAQRTRELAAAADRFARGYAKWADQLRAHPIEGYLQQLNAAEAYLRRAKEMLDLMENYLRMSKDFGNFVIEINRFMKELTGLHNSIQKFAKLVRDAPLEMPIVKPEGNGLGKPATPASPKSLIHKTQKKSEKITGVPG